MEYFLKIVLVISLSSIITRLLEVQDVVAIFLIFPLNLFSFSINSLRDSVYFI